MEQRIELALAEGYEVVQEGRVLRPPERGVAFSARCSGFDVQMLGPYVAPTYMSPFQNLLLDNGKRWVHLRRRRPEVSREEAG